MKPSLFLLSNPVMPYAWGSKTAISELRGLPPSDSPQAELWMGAHPKAPSRIRSGNQEIPLSEAIRNHPDAFLGSRTSEQFGPELPFLFKVLAAGAPLSVQAHPDRLQARLGFERENREKIPLNAPGRSYRDGNHKPECICALSPFRALNGFRPVREIIENLGRICPVQGAPLGDILKSGPPESGLKHFFGSLMSMEANAKKRLLSEALEASRLSEQNDPVCRWILRLHEAYPGDAGVLSPLFLHLVRLEPGEAMFLPAGVLHSYLKGTGIELMANSDNVLRGGLTPKHVDLPELLRVLDFSPRPVSRLTPVPVNSCEGVYPTEAEEFLLSVLTVGKGTPSCRIRSDGPRILLCTKGSVRITETETGASLAVQKGDAVFIPAAVRACELTGEAVLYRASVPNACGGRES